MAEKWISIDEAQDVLGSIRHALRVAPYSNDDPSAWKWVFLALHSAIQGACVCHLVTSAPPVGVISPRDEVKWIRHFEESRSNAQAVPPRTYLMALPDLLRAARKPQSAGDRRNSMGIALTDSELEWLTRLHNRIRNQFVHFEPMGWSIEVSGIPEFAVLAARIIGEICNAGYAFRHLEGDEIQQIRVDFDRLSTQQWFAA